MAQKKKPTKMTARVGDEAVRAKTGKTWSEWFSVLDKAGAAKLNHTEIATYLYNKQKVPGWWCQMVAVGYEQSRGLRKVHETSTGFQSSISKTIGVPVSALYKAWKDERVRSRWLPRAPMTIRKATANKSIRVAWDGDISNMDVRFYARGAGKSQVAIDQVKLRSAADVSRMKTFWGERLQKLQRLLEG
jgi:hypothetical protein